MKWILTFISLLVMVTITGAQTNNPTTPNHSQYNWKNSPQNFKNSPQNYDNSPYGLGKNVIRDENGNAIGYQTEREDGGRNYYDWDGEWKGYSDDGGE